MRVFRAKGEPLEVKVFRVLNVEEHPELRAAALEGTLNRLDDGEPIDVPFVYHDPNALQFVLVVPSGAAGRELSERARLLKALMKEGGQDLPSYVRDFAVARGYESLRSLVEDHDVIEVDPAELEPIELAPPEPEEVERNAIGTTNGEHVVLLPMADVHGRDATECATVLEGETLWLFGHVSADHMHAFTEASSDLLIQLKVVDQVAVVVLTLLDTPTGRRRRAFLNPLRAADRPVLDSLRRSFRATVVIQTDGGELLRSYGVEAPRTRNVQAILDRVRHAPKPTSQRWQAIVEACRAAPPSVTEVSHPFAVDPPARDARQALDRLHRMERWSTPKQFDRAVAEVSVPWPVLELAQRRVVVDGVRYGLAMSTSLLSQGVRFGLAPDVGGLLQELGRRFQEMMDDSSPHGLTEDEIHRNLQALERLRGRHATSTGPILSCNMQTPE